MSIRTTALALALSASFLTSAQAAPVITPATAWELCKAVGRHASEIGEARNKGISRALAMEVAETAPVSLAARLWKQGMIGYTYDHPHVSPWELFFIGALACMDQSMAEASAPVAPAKKLRR